MAFEDKEAELGVLFTRMQNELEDWASFTNKSGSS